MKTINENCFVCNEKMKPYFTKMRGGTEETYEKCTGCGLVINKTMYMLTADEYEKVNVNFHKKYQGHMENELDPNWVYRLKTQSQVLAGLFSYGVLNLDSRTIDYGCGDGKLSQYVDDAFYRITNRHPTHQLIGNFDRYMAWQKSLNSYYYSMKDITPHSFDVVISCSVLEHLIGFEEVDSFFSLQKDDGMVCLHTLICEAVPCDPNWFYIRPSVHCTLWTNRAMKIIYDKYNYKGCAYNTDAKMWLFFKDEDKFEKLRKVGERIYGSFIFSQGFVDYWKELPYR